MFTVPMFFYDNALLKAKPDIEIYVYRFDAEVKVSSLIGDLLHRSLFKYGKCNDMGIFKFGLIY